MIHGFFLLVGVFMLIWGVVICALLISGSLKAGKAAWLVAVPGVLIVAVLALNFACHIFHISPILPHQKQLAVGIDWALRLAAIPLLLAKLFEVWRKRRNNTAKSH